MKIKQNFSCGDEHECYFTDIDGNFFNITIMRSFVGGDIYVEIYGPGDIAINDNGRPFLDLFLSNIWGGTFGGFLEVRNINDTHFGIYLMDERVCLSGAVPGHKQLYILVTPWVAKCTERWKQGMTGAIVHRDIWKE